MFWRENWILGVLNWSPAGGGAVRGTEVRSGSCFFLGEEGGGGELTHYGPNAVVHIR